MRSRFSGESATTKTPVRRSMANATGLMIRPGSLPMWTISHALACPSSTPNTICLRRSKMKYWPAAARDLPRAIEDEILAGRRACEAGAVPDPSGEVRGDRVDRVEHGGAKRVEH